MAAVNSVTTFFMEVRGVRFGNTCLNFVQAVLLHALHR